MLFCWALLASGRQVALDAAGLKAASVRRLGELAGLCIGSSLTSPFDSSQSRARFSCSTVQLRRSRCDLADSSRRSSRQIRRRARHRRHRDSSASSSTQLEFAATQRPTQRRSRPQSSQREQSKAQRKSLCEIRASFGELRTLERKFQATRSIDSEQR